VTFAQSSSEGGSARFRAWWRGSAPYLLGLLVLLLVLTVARELIAGQERELHRQERTAVRVRLDKVANAFTALFSRRHATLAGLAAFADLEREGEMRRQDFERFATSLRADDPVVRALQLFPRAGPVLVHPMPANEMVSQRTLADLLNDPRPDVREDVQLALQRRRHVISRPMPLRQGGSGIAMRRPIFEGDQPAGFATVILDSDVTLGRAGLPALIEDLRVEVVDAFERVFLGESLAANLEPVRVELLLPGGRWRMAAAPRAGWGAGRSEWRTRAWVLAGVLALGAGAAALVFARRQQQLEALAAAQRDQLGEQQRDYRQLFEQSEAMRTTTEAARQVAEADRRRVEESARRLEEETDLRLAESAHSRQVLLSLLEDQKATEVALRESEDRYRSLVEASFEWVWEVDADGRYTYASPRVFDLLGYRPDEVLGRTPFDFMPPEEAGRMLAEFGAQVAARRSFKRLENLSLHRDGRLVVLETSGIPLLAADGTFAGYRGVNRDITARREAERTLRLRSAALEAAANAVVITDRHGVIEWANPAFTALSGWELAEAAGHNPRDFLKSGQHDAAFYQRMWSCIAAGRVWRGEVINRRKDGALRTEDMTITPLHDERGEITHYIAIKQDITEQKELESRLQQSQRVEAIGTLAGGIAHDLNNILAPVLLVTGVLRERLKNAEDRDILELAQTSAQRGAEIVRQLLTFSRGQKGQRSQLQARHLIKEMVGIMRETFPREIGVHSQVAPELWPVVADPTQLHQVLLNLGVNARDAMPEGGRLTLAARNCELAPGDAALPHGAPAGRYVVFEVQDTGHGIPPEIRQRIFDPFFTTKPVGKGTGLGLSTVIGIVRGHGGFVTVESAPEAGTTFRVFLPASPGAEATPDSATPFAPAPAPGAGQTILVVDDESSIRETTRRLLEARGYRVLTAADGAEAATLFQKHRADVALVLTDLMMPVMNGLTLIRVLRSLAPGLQIIATSGVSDVDQGRELQQLGVADLLPKPVEVPVLLGTIARLLAPRPE
jgi:two-component system cell cycle sensor histidine kinase/response regulator CckA